ncbi:MAG: hypothetical protein KF901_31195 [Myxococcales bacterium]|nr:hypothetical protein [Myxococcales bacterium]
MLVECSKCGAPLDVKQGERLARCNYCDATTRVGQTRTIAVVTPAQWAPPQVWTPPPQSGLPGQALAYHQTRKVVRGVMTMVIVFTVLSVVLPILIFVGVSVSVCSSVGSSVGSRPATAAPTPTRWDGASPLVCGANQHLVLEDVETPSAATPGVLVQVTGYNCKLTFRRVKLRGATLVRGGGNLELTFESSSFQGNVFAELENNNQVRIERSVISVERLVTRANSTQLAIRGPTQIRASRVITELDANARVDVEGADVSLESEGEGLTAENNARIRLHGARVIARGGPAIRVADNAELELDGVTLEGKLEGLRVGRNARLRMRQGSVVAEGAAVRAGRSLRVDLDGTRVEGAPAFDFDDGATGELRGATIVGERRTGRRATIQER